MTKHEKLYISLSLLAIGMIISGVLGLIEIFSKFL